MSTTPRKKRAAAPKNETKAAKFSRLASARVGKALKAIAQVGNLASRSYEFNEGQVKAIHGYISDAWKAQYDKFNAVLSGGSVSKPEAEIKI
jgi:hypothetical protein